MADPKVMKPPYPRHRERLTNFVSRSRWAWYNITVPQGVRTYTVPWTESNVDLSGGARKEVMDDMVTPAYAEIRAKGGIVNSPMSRTTTVRSGSDAGWMFQYVFPTVVYYGEADPNYFSGNAAAYPNHVIPAGPPASEYDNLLVEMVTQLRAKVNASTAQLAVSLGEMRETLSLLARPTQGLGRIIEQVARMGKSRNPTRNMSEVYHGLESLWLTGRYGWRPLMLDIEKFLEAYGESRWKLRDRVAVKRELPEISGPALQSKLDIGGGFYFSAEDRTTHARTLVMGNFHELANPTRTMDDLLGLRLQDMPLAAWNLIPFSFVVDWFVNVSQVLGTLASYNTVNLADWFITEDRVKTVRQSGAGICPTGWSVVRHTNCTLVREDVTLTRRPYLPRNPGLAFREGSVRRFFQGDLRNLDTLALLTTTFRTGRLPALRGVR